MSTTSDSDIEQLHEDFFSVTEQISATLTSVDTLLKSLQKLQKRIAKTEAEADCSWYQISHISDTITSHLESSQPSLTQAGRYIGSTCCYVYLSQLLSSH